MSFKTQIILRRIAKVVLFLTGLGLFLYAGYLTYVSISSRPYNVRVTNITDSSFTVSWVTDAPMKGIVYYKEKDSVLPGPLGWIASESAVDDRDFAKAQSKCVEDFNTEASKDMSDDFTVSGDNFDCENVEVKEYGKYYTHHVTLKNLDSEKEYFFKVGDGYLSWGLESERQVVDEDEYPTATKFSSKTFSILDSVDEPNPAYGSVVGVIKEGENYRDDDDVDALVFARLVSFDTDSESTLLSSVTNSSGGWYVDKSMVRQEDGSIHEYVIDDDFLYVGYQYRNYDDSKIMMLRLGYEDAPAPEIAGVTEDELKNMDVNESWWEKVKDFVVNKVDADCNANGCATYAELMEYRASGNTNASEKQVRQAQNYVNSSNFEAEKSKQMNSLLSAGDLSTSTKENVVGYAKAIANAKDNYEKNKTDENLKELERLKNTPGLSSVNPTLYQDVSTAYNTYYTAAGGYTSEDRVAASAGAERWEEQNRTKTELVSIEIGLSDDKSSLRSLKIDGYNLQVGQLSNIQKEKIMDSCSGNTKCSISVETIAVEWKAESLLKAYREKKAAGGDLSGSQVQVLQNQVAIISDDVEKRKETLKEVYWADILFEELNECRNSSGSAERSCIEAVEKKYSEEGKVITCPSQGVFCKVVEEEASRTANKSSVLYGFDSIVTSESPIFSSLKSFNKEYLDSEIIFTYDREKMNECLSNLCEKEEAEHIKKLLEVVKPDTYFFLFENPDKEGSYSLKYLPPYEEARTKIEEEEQGVEEMKNEFGVAGGPAILEGSTRRHNIIDQFFGRAYAEETSQSNSFFFLPEYGSYTLEYGLFTFENKVTDGETIYLFYFEMNGEDGMQLSDGLNSDLLLESAASEITYKKTADAKEVSLKEGINIVSFDWLPAFSYDEIYTAKDFAKKVGDSTIQYIAYFEGGRWSKGISCSSESSCFGEDFPLTPGRGYLIKSSEDKTVMLPGYQITSAVPINFSTGWNLVGVHGYSKAFTARSFIDSINGVSGLTADNVSWWPTAKGKYEGLQVTDSKEYGLDFPISPTNGYFVRINKFEPTDTSCKSIIWHYGGDLNGTCGNSKTILN